MKNIIKIIIWAALLYLLESAFVNIIDIRGFVPELLTAFAAAYAARERRLSSAAYLMLACGLMTGSMVGKSFPISVLSTAAAGTTMYILRERIRFVPMWIKNAAVMIILSFLTGAAEYFAARGFADPGAMPGEVLPYTVYTAVAAVIIYPLVKRTLFGGKDMPKRFAI